MQEGAEGRGEAEGGYFCGVKGISEANNKRSDDDEFEAAREREKTAEGVLDREWLDTEEGTLEYEPGALLRAFKQSKNGEDKDSRES